MVKEMEKKYMTAILRPPYVVPFWIILKMVTLALRNVTEMNITFLTHKLKLLVP